MNKNNFLPITFSPSHVKVFIGTLIATFAVVTLQLLGVKPPALVNPLPQKANIFFDVITPKLEEKGTSYRIHTDEGGFIAKADASAEYDEAAGYAVIDYDTGEVLASKNLSKRLPIASLTKIMSSVVALDLADPSESFEATETAAEKIPTKIAVQPGEQLTLEELLHAAMLTSANDAVEMIREGIDDKYGEDVFIRAMNAKAVYLGLENTSFANSQGFDDPGNYSTVEDLAVLSHYAVTNYPVLAEIAKKDYTLLSESSQHQEFHLYNWNGLIGVYPDTIGLKIGNTGAAGKTTVVISERAGRKMIAIVLGAPGIIERDMWAAKLLDLGYQKSMGLAAVNVTEEALREKYQTWKSWN